MQFLGGAKSSKAAADDTESLKSEGIPIKVSPQPSSTGGARRPAPAQDKLKSKLNDLTEQVLRLKDLAGLMTGEELEKLRGLTN